MTRAGVVLAAGLALTAAAVAVTLSRSPQVLAGRNSIQPGSKLARTTTDHAEGCQAGETLPRRTSAIRLSLFAVVGPSATVKVRSGSHVITTGTRAPGWVGSVVTVPVRPVARTHSPVEVCFELQSLDGPVQVLGEDTPPARAIVSAGRPLAGRISIEYLRPGGESWWSRASSIARNMALGRAAGGEWNVFLAIALMTAVMVLSALLAARKLR